MPRSAAPPISARNSSTCAAHHPPRHCQRTPDTQPCRAGGGAHTEDTLSRWHDAYRHVAAGVHATPGRACPTPKTPCRRVAFTRGGTSGRPILKLYDRSLLADVEAPNGFISTHWARRKPSDAWSLSTSMPTISISHTPPSVVKRLMKCTLAPATLLQTNLTRQRKKRGPHESRPTKQFCRDAQGGRRVLACRYLTSSACIGKTAISAEFFLELGIRGTQPWVQYLRYLR